MHVRVVPSLAVALVAGSVVAGDHGLRIDDGLATPCKADAVHSNNTCMSEPVFADLRAHHVRGERLKVAAVRVGLAHCTVGFASSKERAAFAGAIAALLAEPVVVDERGLLHTTGCFPFEWMRAAIDQELAREGHSSEAKRRLRKAHALVVKRRDATQ